MKKLFIGGCPRSGTGAMCNLLTYDGRAIITEEKGPTAWKSVYNKMDPMNKEKIIYIGDKQPEGYLYGFEKLKDIYPKSKFIFTIRSGFGVIASYNRRVLRRKNIEDIPIESVIKHTKFAEYIWLRAFNKIKTIQNDDRCLIVPYEIACSDINNLMILLSDFLKYDTPVNNIDMLRKGKPSKAYIPVNIDWPKGIEPWLDIIENNVSDKFNASIKIYNKWIEE